MMRPRFGLTVLLVFGALAFVARDAGAHHGPSAKIQRLTQLMAAGNRTALRLVQRADEYRAVGEVEAAATDYRSALLLKPTCIPALYGLARVCYSQSRMDAARAAASRGIAVAANADEAAPFHAVMARTFEQEQAWENASAAWRRALVSSRPQVDWFLAAARTLELQDRYDDARRSLEEAMARNASAVLRRAWIKTLILCGHTTMAADQIELGIARARWKSSWLLLRAILNLTCRQPEAARRDAHAALQEIDARLHGRTVNPFLAADKGLALAILERHHEASIYFKQAAAHGVSPVALPSTTKSAPAAANSPQ